MLPDFPMIKKSIEKDFNAYVVDSIHDKDPLLGQIKLVTIHEGDRSVVVQDNDHVVDDPFQEFESTLKVETIDIIENGVEAYYRAASSLIREMQERQSKLLFQRVDESTQRTGNVIDGKGRDLIDTYLEAIEKTQIEFDSNGNPTQIVVVGPENEAKLRELYSDQTFQIQYKHLMKKKWEEWCDRENNRKLVD